MPDWTRIREDVIASRLNTAELQMFMECRDHYAARYAQRHTSPYDTIASVPPPRSDTPSATDPR